MPDDQLLTKYKRLKERIFAFNAYIVGLKQFNKKLSQDRFNVDVLRKRVALLEQLLDRLSDSALISDLAEVLNEPEDNFKYLNLNFIRLEKGDLQMIVAFLSIARANLPAFISINEEKIRKLERNDLIGMVEIIRQEFRINTQLARDYAKVLPTLVQDKLTQLEGKKNVPRRSFMRRPGFIGVVVLMLSLLSAGCPSVPSGSAAPKNTAVAVKKPFKKTYTYKEAFGTTTYEKAFGTTTYEKAFGTTTYEKAFGTTTYAEAFGLKGKGKKGQEVETEEEGKVKTHIIVDWYKSGRRSGTGEYGVWSIGRGLNRNSAIVNGRGQTVPKGVNEAVIKNLQPMFYVKVGRWVYVFMGQSK